MSMIDPRGVLRFADTTERIEPLHIPETPPLAHSMPPWQMRHDLCVLHPHASINLWQRQRRQFWRQLS
jgi:hypothetical protein